MADIVKFDEPVMLLVGGVTNFLHFTVFGKHHDQLFICDGRRQVENNQGSLVLIFLAWVVLIFDLIVREGEKKDEQKRK